MGRKYEWIAAIGVLTGLAGCGTAGQGDGGELAGLSNRVPVTIMLPQHQAYVPSGRLVDVLQKTADTRLNLEWVPYENYKDRMVNILETKAYRPVMFVNQPDYILVKNEIRAGEFWELGPYLQDYPNLSRLNPAIMDEASVDGKWYGLYGERPPSRQGVMLRKDWLDGLGLEEPRTVEELYSVLHAFTYRDPDGNGLDDTIGLTDRNDLVYGAFKTLSSYLGTPNNWAVEGDRLVPEFRTEEYIQTMDLMGKLYKEGVLNRDFAITSKRQQRYMLTSGMAGGYIGSMADAPRLREELRQNDPKAELTVINRIAGPQGVRVWSIPSYNGVFLFSKKMIQTEEELRDILHFFDRTLDTDVVNLLLYGLEGIHYEMDEGEVAVNPAMSRRYNTEVLPLYSLLVGSQENPHIYPLKEDGGDPFSAKVHGLIRDNSSFLIRDPAQSLLSPTYEETGSELDQIIQNATYQYILGQIDSEGFRQELIKWENMGGTRVEAEYAEAYSSQGKLLPRN